MPQGRAPVRPGHDEHLRAIERTYGTKPHACRQVEAGHSRDVKLIVTCGERELFVRFARGRKRLAKFQGWQDLCRTHTSLAAIVACEYDPDVRALCVVSEFVAGVPLHHHMRDLTAAESYLMGVEMAAVLRALHAEPVDGAVPHGDTMLRYWLKLFQIPFGAGRLKRLPPREVIKHVGWVVRRLGVRSYIHGDTWAANVIVGDAGMKLIDPEGFGVGDPWSDVVQFMRTDTCNGRAFALGVIEGYFSSDVPSEFWQLADAWAWPESARPGDSRDDPGPSVLREWAGELDHQLEAVRL